MTWAIPGRVSAGPQGMSHALRALQLASPSAAGVSARCLHTTRGSISEVVFYRPPHVHTAMTEESRMSFNSDSVSCAPAGMVHRPPIFALAHETLTPEQCFRRCEQRGYRCGADLWLVGASGSGTDA